MVWRAALTLVLVALTACPGVTRPLEAPRVELERMALAADGARLELELAVLNRDAAPLEARALDWQIAGADGEPVARGRIELAASLPPRQSTTVQAEADIPPGAAAALASLTGPIEVTGMVHCFGPRGSIGATFGDGVAQLRSSP
jgi:hypothetical protein